MRYAVSGRRLDVEPSLRTSRISLLSQEDMETGDYVEIVDDEIDDNESAKSMGARRILNCVGVVTIIHARVDV